MVFVPLSERGINMKYIFFAILGSFICSSDLYAQEVEKAELKIEDPVQVSLQDKIRKQNCGDLIIRDLEFEPLVLCKLSNFAFWQCLLGVLALAV